MRFQCGSLSSWRSFRPILSEPFFFEEIPIDCFNLSVPNSIGLLLRVPQICSTVSLAFIYRPKSLNVDAQQISPGISMAMLLARLDFLHPLYPSSSEPRRSSDVLSDITNATKRLGLRRSHAIDA